MNKKSKIIITLLLIVIVILFIFAILFATDVISLGNSNNNDIKQNIEKKYTAYSKGETITLKDKSKWLVLSDSNETNEIVKLMNINDFVLYGDSCSNQTQYIYCTDQFNYSKIFKEYFNNNTEYKNSYIEELVNSFANLVPVTLKEVNGYKIRLLSINDILEYDNAWDKKDSNTYFYTGNNLNDNFLGAWLMDTVENQCDNCSKFFVVKTINNPEASIPNGIYLQSGASGLSEIKPVIYAYKDSI